MARYNTVSTTLNINGATTLSTPLQGSTLITLSGTAPYTVTIPSPALFPGVQLSFFNNTGGIVTLSSPSGAFIGPALSGASTQAIANNAVLELIPDGTNYANMSFAGGDQRASSLTVTGAMTVSPAAGAVTFNPTATGTIDNIAIGNTTKAAGGFTALTATGTSTLQQITEVLNTKSGASGTVVHDFATGDIWNHTSIGGNFIANFTNVPTTTTRTITFTLILNQGGTPFIPTGCQINSGTVTPQWAGGVTPSGRASKTDVVTFFVTNVSGTFIILAQLSSYG